MWNARPWSGILPHDFYVQVLFVLESDNVYWLFYIKGGSQINVTTIDSIYTSCGGLKVKYKQIIKQQLNTAPLPNQLNIYSPTP